MTSNQFLSQVEWVALPMQVRVKLRELFKIPKSGHVRVQTIGGKDRVVSDGTEPEDLMISLNVETAISYLGEKIDDKKQYDFSQIFPLVLAKAGFAPVESHPERDPEAAKGKDPDPVPARTKAPKEKVDGGKKIKIGQKKK